MFVMDTLAAFALALIPVWIILGALIWDRVTKSTVWNRQTDTSSLDWGEPGDPQ